MARTGNEKARRGRWTLAAVAAAVAAVPVWAVYRVTSTRGPGARMAADTSDRTYPNAAAGMSRFTPGATPIPCQPWDIGTGVTGYVWHAPNPRAALLLQHGYAEYAQRYVRHYHQIIPHLLRAGISVYAFDLWGHGRSPGKRAVTDVGRAVEDHLAARRRLREQPFPVFLLGHSLGGLITTASVLRDQNGLSGVILSSPFLRRASVEGAFTRLLANALAAVVPTLPAPAKPPELNGLSAIPEQVEAFAADPLIYHGRMPILLAATSLNLSAENRRRYPGWTVPVLLLHGTADTYTDPRGSRELFEAVAARDKTLHVVEGGRHELLNDTERDETLRVLLTWLERGIP